MSDPVYQLATAVRDRLAKMRVAATVSYGQPVDDEGANAPRIEIMRDRERGDTFASAVTAGPMMLSTSSEQRTPRGSATVGVIARISALSSHEGAGEQDDVGETWRLVQDLWCAIVVCSHVARTLVTDGTGSFVASSAPAAEGAVYELRFGLRVAVEELTGIRAGAPLLPSITTKVRQSDGDTPEIAAGPGP